MLPPEYLRSGRWDAIFFIDIPDINLRKDIFEYYCNKFNIKDDIGDDVLNIKYTGAEIETICRLSSVLNIKLNEAKDYVKPIVEIDKDNINELIKKAKNVSSKA